MRRAVLFVILLLLALRASCGQDASVVMGATDIDGHRLALAVPAQTRAVVLFFLASDCPISNREIPEMERVRQRYAGQGVRFWFVYPNVTESAAMLHAHRTAFGLTDPALTDPQGDLAHLAGAGLTPEAAVLVPARGTLRLVYSGRIDNRYLQIGQERPQATEHDLEQAVAAILAGRKPNAPGGPAVGCGIVSSR